MDAAGGQDGGSRRRGVRVQVPLGPEGLDAVATGRILELVPEKRLSYTFVSSRSGSGSSLTDSVVTWTLDELTDGKTRVTLVHSGITKEVYGDTDAGWGYYTSQLARYCREMVGPAGDA